MIYAASFQRRQVPLSVIPAKRSASRNPAHFSGIDLHSGIVELDSRVRGNDDV